jgi:serine phosphatase RsbU (regulator of sigma subunit)
LLYTDGVVESPDNLNTLFGQERLEEFLVGSPTLSPQQMISGLRDRLQKFSGLGTPADDTTVIAIGVSG